MPSQHARSQASPSVLPDTRGARQAQASCPNKNHVASKSLAGDIPGAPLVRTDTTIDRSQNAEKSITVEGGRNTSSGSAAFHYSLSSQYSSLLRVAPHRPSPHIFFSVPLLGLPLLFLFFFLAFLSFFFLSVSSSSSSAHSSVAVSHASSSSPSSSHSSSSDASAAILLLFSRPMPLLPLLRPLLRALAVPASGAVRSSRVLVRPNWVSFHARKSLWELSQGPRAELWEVRAFSESPILGFYRAPQAKL